MSGRCDYWWEDSVKYGLSVTTQPALEPVTVQDVKDNALIFTSEGDAWLQGRITAARDLCETFVKRAFIDTTFRLTLDWWPTLFYLPRPPLISVTTIKYLDLDGVQQTWSASNYSVDTYTEPGRVSLAYNVVPPNYRQIENTIEVIYHAGYGTAASNVPQAIKDAIVLTVTNWHAHRGDEEDIQAIPDAAKALLRSKSFGFWA